MMRPSLPFSARWGALMLGDLNQSVRSYRVTPRASCTLADHLAFSHSVLAQVLVQLELGEWVRELRPCVVVR